MLIDLDILERNLVRLSAHTRERGIYLRPHTKTHKIPEIAKMQISSGACGVTVAKVGEARVIVEAGVSDVLVAYPIACDTKAAALAALARDASIAVSLDSVASARVPFRERLPAWSEDWHSSRGGCGLGALRCGHCRRVIALFRSLSPLSAP